MKDYKALAAKAAEVDGKDMTKAVQGGGDYEPPKAGFCLLRLVGYFEIGKQKGSFQGKPTIKDMVQMVFEVSGPNHPPTVKEDGSKVPHRIVVEENFSLNEKARFFRLFNRMNYKGDTQHMVGLLGDPFKANLIHRKYKRRQDPADAAKWTGLAVEIWDKKNSTWTIEPPRVDVVDQNTMMPTGEVRVLTVPPALTPLKAFLWNHSDMEDWNSLFIEGEYPERKNEKGEVTKAAQSKNVIQNTIKQATNFVGSPIYNLIAEAGGNLDIPAVTEMGDEDPENDPATVPETKTVAPVVVPDGDAADDALNGVI